MRDYPNNRGRFDRVLMAVAATFLTVSVTSAMAQGPNRATPAELAIDAAVPRPEPVNLPPPTAADFKMDTTASTAPAVDAKPADAKPIDVAAPAPAVPSTTSPAAATLAPSVPLPSTPLTPSTDSAPPAAAAASAPPADPRDKASTGPAANQPVADKLKDMLAAKSLRYFDRKVERAAVEKFYGAPDYAQLWTASRNL